MRTVAPIIFVFATAALAAEPPTYAEALSEAELLRESAELREWGESVLQPILNRVVPEIATCASKLPDPGSVEVRVVIDFAQSPARIYDESPGAISSCVRSRLEALTWSRSPPGLRYLPLELKLTMDSKSDAPADDFVISVTPTNTSPERTRER